MRQDAVAGRQFDTGFPFLGSNLLAHGFGFGYEVEGHALFSLRRR
jgi:phosphomannomutase